MVTSWKRFITDETKRKSALNKLTGNVTKPVSVPASLQQQKEVPASVQNIIKNQPGTPSGSISAPTKSNAQLRVDYQKQQIADKAKKTWEKIVSNTASLLESAGSEIEAAAATKFTMNAAEVKEAAMTNANLATVDNEKAQAWKSRVGNEFSRMMWDATNTPEPFEFKLGFSPSPFKIWLMGFLGNDVSLTSGISSVTKPVIKTIDYDNVLWQAYDTITYKAANEKEIMTVENFDELFPEYKDVPYDQKQIFINECLYDVQQGKKRDINEFANFFGSMSMKEGYVNQQDATIQYITDPDVSRYSLNAFLAGTEELEWRTPEEIRDYIEAAYTIKAYADEINKQWYNVTDSAGWTIVKSFADDFEDLNQAIKTFEKFNLTTTEAYKINNLYEKNLRTQNELVNDFVYGNEIEQHNALKQFEDEYLHQFHKDYINSFIREVTRDYQKDMEKYGSSDWNELMMWLYQDYYELDWKYYNKDWEEILHSEWRDWFLNKVAEWFIGLASEVETLWFDTAMAQKAWKEWDAERERTMDVLFDTVNVAFSGMMEFTGGWQLFQFATTLWRAWAQLDWLFSKTMEWLGSIAEGLADMIWFTDGWSKDSKEKYKQAMEWIWIMLIWRLKNHMVKKGKAELLKYLDDTAMMKALKAYVAQTAEWLEVRDGWKVKEVIKNKGKTEEKKGEPKTRKEVEERAKEEKKTEEIKTEDTTQRGKITMKQGTQENALRSFREIFDNEIEKINAEGESPKLVDSLFQAASSLVDRLFSKERETPKTEKTPEIASDVPVEWKTEITGPEAVERETAPEEQTVDTTPEAPGVVVKEASTREPEELEWTAEVREPDNVKETKTTISKILDVIQTIQDNAKALVTNLFKTNEEKQARNAIVEREARDELFRREWLTEKQIEIVENNPFTDSIMRIVNRLVSEITDKKWKVKDTRLEDKLSNDEIQREVLSDGLTRMQKYVDRIQQLKKAIGQLYEALSTKKTMKSRDFLDSEPFQRLLEENWLKYVERLDDKGNPKRAVMANDWRVLNANERAVVKYLESMIDIITEKSWISERDAQSIRTNFTSKWDRDSSGNFPKAIKKTLYERRNEFLEQQWGSEVLRKIDQGYAELSENLEVLSDLLSKDLTLKDNAKNKILKWDEETLNQIDGILPGFKKLVELTKESPDIVNKTIKAKTQYKQTRVWLWNWIRYAWVMLASRVGWRWGFVLGSLWFTTLERIWNAFKKKAVKTKLDRDLYNQYVDALKVDWNTKAEYKQWELERYNELSRIAEWKTQAEMNKIMDEATQILIDRQAQEIRERKLAEEERQQRIEQSRWNNYLREKGVGDTTPKLPEATQWWVVATDTFTLPQDRWVKETYKDKEKTQQGYNNAEQQIIDASLGKTEETTYSPEAEKVADILEKSLNETSDIIEEDATNKVIEKWEELTDENIAKEIQKEPFSIEEFIAEMEKGTPEESTNYDWADMKDLEKVVENPEKYPNVDIEAARSALEKARMQNIQAEMMQSPDQQQSQREIAGIYKGNQMELEHNKWWEKQREDMVRETNRDFDSLETTDEYDRIERNITPEEWEQAIKYTKWYKGFYRADKTKTDMLRADMGKKPSQNITYTSSADKIATLENPKTRARVAQQRLDKRKKLSEEEKTQLNQIIDQANVEIQAKEDLKAQKMELANEYKRLDKKRSETPYRETKKEITKKMDKIADEFDKLTSKEAGEMYSKPKEVEEMEVKEQAWAEEFDKAMDINETPQTDESIWEKEQFIADKFNERYGANEPATFRQRVTWMIQKIKESKKEWNRNEFRKNLKELDSLINDKVDEWIVEMEFFLDKWNKEFDERPTDKTVEREEYYHASDTDIKEWTFDLSKTKDDPNWIWLAVSIEKENPYWNKPNQYTISGKDMKVAREWTTLSESDIRDIAEILQIEPNTAWKYVPAAELTSIIRWEVESKYWKADNKTILDAFNRVTWYDGVETSHGYALLWNQDKINKSAKKNKGWDKPEEPTTPKKEIKADKQLVDVAKDGSINKEPMVWDYTTEEIQARIDFLKQKRADNWKKLYAQELNELNVLKKLLERQKERESREEWGTELSDRQREILNSNNYGDVYKESKSD